MPTDAATTLPPRPRSGAALLVPAVAVLLFLAYLPSLDWLWGRWLTDPFYSHGPLVPVVSLLLLWSRRADLRTHGKGSQAGVWIIAGAALLHLLGARLRFELLSMLSLLLTLAGLAVLSGGKDLLKAIRFPLVFLLFGLPLPILLVQQVSLPLQLLSTACARAVLASLGCDVLRHGVLLAFPRFTLAVADACSGLRSLITVLAIATLIAHLSPGSLRRKAALVALSSIVAVGVNVLRITLSGLIGLAFDGETACLLFERYSGYFFIVLVILTTLGIFRVLRDEAAVPESPPALPPPPGPSRPLALRILLPLAFFTLPAAILVHPLAGATALPPPTRLAGWEPILSPWKASEVRSLQAFPGEEAVTGKADDPPFGPLRWSILHSVSGRYLHSPEACSLAAGWIPERQELREDGGIPIHLWILRRGSDRMCVLFWFLQDGMPRRGSLDQHVGALGRRLWRGTVDSAYGELVRPLPVGTEPDSERLLALARGLQSAVRERLWPTR